MISYIIMVGLTLFILAMGLISSRFKFNEEQWTLFTTEWANYPWSEAGPAAWSAVIVLLLLIPLVYTVVAFGKPVPRPGELRLFWLEPVAEEEKYRRREPRGMKPLFSGGAYSEKAKSTYTGWGSSIVRRVTGKK